MTVEQLQAAAAKDESYQLGYDAGAKWARELPEVTDLDAMETASTWPTLDVPPYVRSFVFGVGAAWDDLGGNCFVRSA